MTVAQGTPRTEEALAKVIAYNERINAQSRLPGGVMINPADYPPDGWAIARELERENAALSAQVVELQKDVDRLRGAMADFAVSDDITLERLRRKAKRLYEETEKDDL